jgi:hypothetical protein
VVREPGIGRGKANVVIRAGLEEAAAFFWDFESNIHLATTDDHERVMTQGAVDWEAVVWRRQKIASKHGMKHRERGFKNIMTMHRVARDVLVIEIEPTSLDEEEVRMDENECSAAKTMPVAEGRLYTLSAYTPLSRRRRNNLPMGTSPRRVQSLGSPRRARGTQGLNT